MLCKCLNRSSNYHSSTNIEICFLYVVYSGCNTSNVQCRRHNFYQILQDKHIRTKRFDLDNTFHLINDNPLGFKAEIKQLQNMPLFSIQHYLETHQRRNYLKISKGIICQTKC